MSDAEQEAMIRLDEAAEHVGKRVRFAAAVQQVTTGKRALVARQRVKPYHVLHVADATRRFFKVTCWGSEPPRLTLPGSLSASSKEQEQAILRSQSFAANDAAVRVGDIVLFSGCRVKTFRGNVEAQFLPRNEVFASSSASSSMVQLLYRKDRYFDTLDVRLTDLYPMIKWYKQHRHEFLLRAEGSPPPGSACALSYQSPSVKRRKISRTLIKDLRESMVTSVVCKLREPQQRAGAAADSGSSASELDGVVLYELVMFDAPQSSMTLNMWDHHADRRLVARLLAHSGAVEIIGAVVSIQALSNRLLANTTPQTTFRLLEADDPEAEKLKSRLGSTARNGAGYTRPLSYCSEPYEVTTFATLEELEKTTDSRGSKILENVRVELICFGRQYGDSTKIVPKFASILAECYCTGCEQSLPELTQSEDAAPLRYGGCENHCKARRAAASPHAWRYRSFQMVLLDAQNKRLQVQVESQAVVELVGNIDARLLVEASVQSPSSYVTTAVTSLLNALVKDGSQTFRAELNRVELELSGEEAASLTAGSMESTPVEDVGQVSTPVFTLVSLLPTPLPKLPF